MQPRASLPKGSKSFKSKGGLERQREGACKSSGGKLGGNGLAQENSDDRGGACGDLGADSISSDRVPWVANKSFEISKFKLKISNAAFWKNPEKNSAKI